MRTPMQLARAFVTIAALAAVTATEARAQVAAPAAPRYRFGLAAGFNLASMTETEDSELKPGFVVGGQLIMPISPVFAIQAELNYSQKGVKGSTVDEESGQKVDVALRHDYIEVPVLARLDIVRPGGGVQPFLLAGPALGVSVKCELEGESQGVSVTIDCDQLLEPSSVDFGAMFGGGLEIPMGARAFTLGARYTLGFGEVFEDGDTQNRVITFLAGIRF